MQIGLVGLNQSGKSTIWGLLTGAPSINNNKPQARVASALVPDDRVEHLAEMYNPRKTTPARIEFVDIPGLIPNEEKKGNIFLEEVRKVDALAYILRVFDNTQVPHLEGAIQPLQDWETIEIELLLADLDLFEKRVERLKSTRKKAAGWEKELLLLEKCKDALGHGLSLRELNLSEEERELLQGYTLLTEKPVIPVINVDESQFVNNDYPDKEALRIRAQELEVPIIEICGQLELEISSLEKDDRTMFLKDLGITETGIQRLAKVAYSTLNLISFFTVGSDEVKAWTIANGTTAQNAAGKIHSDIARGFIRAEVLAYQDLLTHGSASNCRDKGLYRLEGKDYIMHDGDIVNFRFNV